MKKILVIDDSPEIRDLIQISLEANGYDVQTAEDGMEGVEAARKYLPDLIICDVRMPKMDGYQTLSAIRKDSALSMAPFVFLTGATEKNIFRKGMEMGADDFLNKPFTIDELYSAVKVRLEKQARVEEQTNKKLEAMRGTLNLALPHELRTPLTGILGWSAMLEEDADILSPPEIKQYAGQIQISGQRLLRLIENFLAYSQIQWILKDPEKLMAMRNSPTVEIGRVLRETSEKVSRRLNREKDLRTDIVHAQVPMSADHFKKIVEEIADNAFKFSKPDTPVRVESSLNPHTVTVRIEDRGRGMTTDQIAEIGPNMQFERRVYEQQGMGMGLIIAKRLTEAYDGALTIESAPNQGTAVILQFKIESPDSDR